MKNLIKQVKMWLRSIVTAASKANGKETKDNSKETIATSMSNSKGTASTPSPTAGDSLLLRAEEYLTGHYDMRYNRLSREHVYDCLRELSPTAMEGIERSTFGWYLKEIGAQLVRVDNKRLWAVRKIA